MEPTFSPELIERCKEYFRTRCKLEISSGEAELYLASLGDLYEIFEGWAVKSSARPSKEKKS